MDSSDTEKFGAGESAYLEVYSLHRAPFENRVDPDFFYASTALAQQLDLLAHLTEFGGSIVIMTGPRGAGKTTLMERFVAQADSQWQLCVLVEGSANRLAERLADAIGDDTHQDVSEMVEGWMARTDPTQLLVIVVDDAERLDREVCHGLVDLIASPSGERVRIILFGEPGSEQGIEEALRARSVSQGTPVLQVPRLSPEQTAAYLTYRLAVAGYSGESPFTATEVRGICKAADGRPGVINRLAEDALREQHLRAQSRRPVAPRRTGARQPRLWLIAGLGVTAVAGYVGWQRLSTPTNAVGDLAALASGGAQDEIPLVLPPPAEYAQPEQSQNTIGEAGETTRSGPALGHEYALAGTRAPSRLAASGAELRAGNAALQLFAPPLSEVPNNHSPDTPPERERAPVDEPTGPDAAPQKDDASNPEPAPTELAAAELEAMPEKNMPKQHYADSQMPAQHLSGERSGAPRREDWLLEQSGHLYSLQLLGSRDEKAVIRFIQDHRLDSSQTAYYRGNFKDSEWFVLLYGLYPSRDAAIAAREALPASLRDNKPWPRSLESIHSAIRDTQR